MFEVHGKKFEIERNDLYALEIENGKHLRLWFSTADQEIWVDQYDVRMLVDVTELHTFNDSLENNLTDDEELDPERYKDLEDSSRTFPPQIEDVSYQIPPSLPIPLGIEVPKTQKQFNIIAHTTKSIRATPQLEIVLKLKQSTTPTFSFLYPENDLYPFYQVFNDGVLMILFSF